MSRTSERGRRGSRRLTPEDRAVWDLIARQVRPLAQAAPSVPETAAGSDSGRAAVPSAPTATPAATSSAALFAAEQGGTRDDTSVARATLRPSVPTRARIAFDLHDSTPTAVGRPEAGLDRRTAERLRRGERAPDARLDLHGMTAERAHLALDRFIASAAAQGLRCVLVITGKGGRGRSGEDGWFGRPDRGVLRHDAPRWLRAGPAAAEIVGIYAAHRRHGGEGAFYVYLKKRR
ncbi:Smr/MutS family protein [Limibaculum sp. FT325]|uniref:Smr/MutS family protein n=1 Tax=Thermohalobaculum sediminis TaxID=2939436 RepID=UPI0020C0F1B9|nr:Smr/MutS family protein [Limibaculum sediminis]MCL5776639.1 Smr/MutS family protein [Limibaculum sediminis]